MTEQKTHFYVNSKLLIKLLHVFETETACSLTLVSQQAKEEEK